MFAIVAIMVAVTTNWRTLEGAIADQTLSPDTVSRVNEVFANTIPWIGRLLLQDFVLAFEIASILLLAAAIGALALIRER